SRRWRGLRRRGRVIKRRRLASCSGTGERLMELEALNAARRRHNASVTLMSLCLTTVLGIALSSYLALCTRSVQFSARLLHNDKARELAQVGLEEALWALNQNDWTSSGPAGTTAWTTSGSDRTVTLSYTLPG